MSAGILKYFSIVDKRKRLPDPAGPLSRTIPSSSIAACNKEVEAVLENGRHSGVKGPYCKLTPSQRWEVGKKAAIFGIASAIHYYKDKFPHLHLTEPTVRRNKNAYLEELKKRPRKDDDDLDGGELPLKKRGRPLLLGKELDQQVQDYVKDLRSRGCPINTSIVIGVGKGIVMNDGNVVSRMGNNVPMSLTKDWAKYVMKRMGYVKRRGNTKAKVNIENFEEMRELYLHEIQNAVIMDEIPPEMVINFDQTGINYVPTSSWSMEREGAKRVEIIGKEDKRQITAVFAGTYTGDFLPIQLVYQGKTPRCLPSFQFPSDWHATYSANHWSNEETMTDYFNKIILPYITDKRNQLNLSSNHPALLIFDNFKGQCTQDILKLLDTNNIDVVIIPPNCTDRLQPLDLSVNKPAKEYLRDKFQNWYASQIQRQLQAGKQEPVDLRLSLVKPLGAKWMVDFHYYLKSKPEIVSNGFKAAGIDIDSWIKSHS